MGGGAPHVLIIGGMRRIRSLTLAEDCRVSWFIRQNPKIDFSDNPRYRQIVIYPPDTPVEQLVALATTLHGFDPFDRVSAFHDDFQGLAVAVADALGLPYDYTAETLARTRDKHRMRTFLAAHGLEQIKFGLVDSVAGVEAFFARHPGVERVILKPVDGTGSLNVRAVARGELARLGEGAGLEFPLAIEEFIDGDEYSVEAFTHGGRHWIAAVTEKFKRADTFMEYGHLVPARIPETVRRAIAAHVERCLTTLGVTCGPTHTEVIVNGSSVTLVETHTRVGGDCIPELVKHATGIDLYQLTAQQAVGRGPAAEQLVPAGESRYACVRFKLQDETGGVISDIVGADEVKRWPQVERVAVEFTVGDTLPPIRHSFDRAASVVVVGDDPDRVLAIAGEAVAKIEFRLEPPVTP